jgi:hypothetical protein
MEMPQPTDAHRRLDTLVGRWRGEERMLPSPWDPKGGTAVGRVRNLAALDGFAVVQDYEQERGGGAVTFRGHGVFRWDVTANEYVLHWFDSLGLDPNEFRGTFDGDVLTLVSRGAQGLTRAVFDFGERGRYSYRMDVSGDGAQWAPMMTGEYARES